MRARVGSELAVGDDERVTSVRLRADLDSIPGYVAGKPAAAGPDGHAFKLSSNELPWPLDPAVTDAIAAAASGANRYPSPSGASLVARVADRIDVPAERIVLGGGSISLLQLLVETVTDPSDAVVHAWRSYEAYPVVIPVCRARSVPVPLRDHGHDLPAMAEAVRRTGAPMVIVCSPNNPTGTAVDGAELEEFIDALPQDCLVVLDEAYLEFHDDPRRHDGVELARRFPNLAVLRTFSKAHGMAGLRVGYCVAPEPVADALRRTALPFLVSSVAEAAAVAALDVWPRQRERVAQIVSRRDRFAAELRHAGFEVPVSRANFVWLPLGESALSLDGALRDAGISVRTFAGDGVRITIGEPEAMDAVLEVARAWSA